MEKLGINWGLLVAQLFNVILVVWLLSRLLYQPILNMLNERTRRIEESLQAADKAKQEVANAKRDYEAELVKARQEAQAIVAQAQERAKSQEAEILSQARGEAKRLVDEARVQAQQERTRLLAEAKGQIAELVTLTASKVLKAELAANHDKLIDESLAALERRN